MSHYGPELAAIHDRHFGMVAQGGAELLLARLAKAGFVPGAGHRVAELACGSGILCRRVLEAGFEAWGVDISPSMLELARRAAPEASFVHGSLWEVEPPACVAVAATGEALCYAADLRAGVDALAERLRSIHAALAPGGLLLFDVASPGRSGPTGTRTFVASLPGAFVSSVEVEAPQLPELTREITSFVADRRSGLYHRSNERHTLRLYQPDIVAEMLDDAGFTHERLTAYEDFEFPVGWHGFLATKAADAQQTTARRVAPET